MSNDSQESPGSRPRFHPSIQTQTQIERLKREDEEEQWISGEELYTEGSSDDDDDRLIIRDPEIHNAENSRFNPTDGQPAASRSRWNHPAGPPRSAQITSRGILQQKLKIDQPDSGNNSGTAQPASEEKLSACSSSAENLDGGGDRGENVAEDVDAEEKEISWRPKRDDNHAPNLIYENSIVELRELQLEYEDILDSLAELKTSLTPFNNSSNSPNSRKRSDNYNENENSADLLSPVIVHLQQNKESTPAEEDIIKDVSFTDENVDQWSNAIINTAKIKKEIFKMMKLDTYIDDIYEKVKKAGEETIGEQILNRKELKRLQTLRAPETGKLEKNTSRFFKLFKMEIESAQGEDISNVYTVHSIYLSQNDPENSRSEEEELRTLEVDEESRQSRREKLEKELTIIDKRRANFIERNKELASCAMGTLAITDEEKKRLEELVEDIDDRDFETDQISTANSSSTTVSTPYSIDKEADELLKNLTEKIANINSETYRKAEEERYTREEFLQQKEQLVLNSLRNLSESGSKMIHPISEEEMRQLIGEYYTEQEAVSSRCDFAIDLKLETLKDEPNSTSIVSETRTISQDVIKELIIEAKTTMPLFQFKHRTESINELKDNEVNEKKSA